MTEHKYTDEEVIKGIKCCIIGDCGGCPVNTGSACRDYLFEGALDLINRQKAEIERLHSEVKEKTETIVFLKDQATGWSIDFCNLKNKLNTAKAEAIKEFAEKLGAYEEVVTTLKDGENIVAIDVHHLHRLVKEMTGENNQ